MEPDASMRPKVIYPDQNAGFRQEPVDEPMRVFFKSALKNVLVIVGRALAFIMFDVKIEGKHHLPQSAEPLIVIANHFSWFDAPILGLLLPFQPAFLVATESYRHWWVRLFVNAFDGIPIWRGQVDRDAFRLSIEHLRRGGSLGIFPEGGMNPDVAALVARGEQIRQLRGHISRRNAQLARARPGVALLAIQSKVPILPVALVGTERIFGNLRRLRRSRVEIRIGPIFGPLDLDENLRGRERRGRLDELADAMMKQIAVLFPPEMRGPYHDATVDAS
jgi:1-acyl-sn-glycerol-3-phosphate acyltransferase